MFKRLIALLLTVSFILSYYQPVYAQDFNVNELPVPGTMIGESAPFAPLALKGLVVNIQKPLEFQFIVDTGRGPQDAASVKDQANQLVKYFLAGLTIPEGDLWVNLSPYEKNRMVPEALGQTDLGRDLLVQDYILKQLAASLIYPEKDLGKEFWSRVYAKAQQQFGTTNVPVNTFNKVWILPDQAQVFEHGAAAYVTKATLKVMLDEDYTALQKHMAVRNGTDSIGANIVRQIVIPEITKEVNTGKNFAPLRQIYQALILAKWYKETIQNGLLDAVYTNKNKIAGVNLNDPAIKEQIYERYLKAYKKGAFNYIKEDPTPDGHFLPRKYFSGGLRLMPERITLGPQSDIKGWDGAMLVITESLKTAGAPQNAVMLGEKFKSRQGYLYRPFGKTGLVFNLLGFGGAWTSRRWPPWRIDSPDMPELKWVRPTREEVFKVYEEAFRLLSNKDGMVLLDSAPAYDDGEIEGGSNEQLVGDFLRAHPDLYKRAFITTKDGEDFVKPVAPGEMPRGNLVHTPSHLKEGLKRSAQRLGGRIDLLWIHFASKEVLGDKDYMNEFQGTREQHEYGIKYLGASFQTVDDLEGAYDHQRDELMQMDAIQMKASVLYGTRPEIINEIHKRGIAIFINSIGREALTNKFDISSGQDFRGAYLKVAADPRVSMILIGSHLHTVETLHYFTQEAATLPNENDLVRQRPESQATLAERLQNGDVSAQDIVKGGIIRIAPGIPSKRVWGGDTLFFSANNNDEKAKSRPSQVALGDGTQIPLIKLLQIMGEQILGKAFVDKYGKQLSIYPKILTATDSLSIQGHPTQSSELYYVLAAEPGATLRLGFKHDIKDKRAFEKRLEETYQRQKDFVKFLREDADQEKMNEVLQAYFSNRISLNEVIITLSHGFWADGVNINDIRRELEALKEGNLYVLNSMNVIEVRPGMFIHNTVPLRYRNGSWAEVHTIGNPEAKSVTYAEFRSVAPTFRLWDTLRFPQRPLEIPKSVNQLSLRGTGPEDFIVEPKPLAMNVNIEQIISTPEIDVQRLHLDVGESIAEETRGEPHFLIVTKGSVEIRAPDGKILGILKECESAIIPVTHGSYQLYPVSSRTEIFKVRVPIGNLSRWDIAKSIPTDEGKDLNITSIPPESIKGRTFFIRFVYEDRGIDPQTAPLSELAASIDIRSIKYLLSHGAKLIAYTHNSKPSKPEYDPTIDVTKPYLILQRLLGENIRVVRDEGKIDSSTHRFHLIAEETRKRAAELQEGEMLFLENVRFDPREESTNEDDRISLARDIVELDQTGNAVFVNDEFGMDHRELMASIREVSLLMPGVKGFSFLEEERRHLPFLKELNAQERGKLVAIFGGAKADKINEITAFSKRQLRKGDAVVLVGKFGGQLISESDKMLLRQSGINILEFPGNNSDLSPDAIARVQALLRQARLVFWEGPVGKFEDTSSRHGGEVLISEILQLLGQGHLKKAFVSGGDLGIQWQRMTGKSEVELNKIEGLTASHGGRTSIAFFAASGNLPGSRFLRGQKRSSLIRENGIVSLSPGIAAEIRGVQNYILDLDGVILDSNPINREAFNLAYCMIKSGVTNIDGFVPSGDILAEANAFFTSKIGTSMSENLRAIVSNEAEHGALKAAGISVDDLIKYFTDIYRTKREQTFDEILSKSPSEIEARLLKPGARAFLEGVKRLNKKAWLVSVSKREERIRILEKLGLVSYFQDMFFVGSLQGKIDRLQTILRDNRIAGSQAVMIDDSPLVIDAMRNLNKTRSEEKEEPFRLVGIPESTKDFNVMLPKADAVVSNLNALLSDRAQLTTPGGIDLNQINVKRAGKTINVQFDPAQLNELEQNNFKGFTPVITGFEYIKSPFPLLLGINTANQPERLAKV